MKKSDRQIVFDKYGGKCAYCGTELLKGWHVDELQPVVRLTRYVEDESGFRIRNKNGTGYKTETKLLYPERMNIENQMPACASCNIQKNSFSLEEFRSNIKQFVNSLNNYSTQYKFAKRYGLVHLPLKQIV